MPPDFGKHHATGNPEKCAIHILESGSTKRGEPYQPLAYVLSSEMDGRRKIRNF
jgi:hypothetical protein